MDPLESVDNAEQAHILRDYLGYLEELDDWRVACDASWDTADWQWGMRQSCPAFTVTGLRGGFDGAFVATREPASDTHCTSRYSCIHSRDTTPRLNRCQTPAVGLALDPGVFAVYRSTHILKAGL
jgi:hypothetical protein